LRNTGLSLTWRTCWTENKKQKIYSWKSYLSLLNSDWSCLQSFSLSPNYHFLWTRVVCVIYPKDAFDRELIFLSELLLLSFLCPYIYFLYFSSYLSNNSFVSLRLLICSSKLSSCLFPTSNSPSWITAIFLNYYFSSFSLANSKERDSLEVLRSVIILFNLLVSPCKAVFSDPILSSFCLLSSLLTLNSS